MGRRGRDIETEQEKMRGDGVWCGEAAAVVEQLQGVPHSYRWIKIRRDTLGVSDPSYRPDSTAQGSSTRKINPHNFLL